MLQKAARLLEYFVGTNFCNQEWCFVLSARAACLRNQLLLTVFLTHISRKLQLHDASSLLCINASLPWKGDRPTLHDPVEHRLRCDLVLFSLCVCLYVFQAFIALLLTGGETNHRSKFKQSHTNLPILLIVFSLLEPLNELRFRAAERQAPYCIKLLLPAKTTSLKLSDAVQSLASCIFKS